MTPRADTPCERWPGKIRASDGRAMEGKRYAYRERWKREVGPLDQAEILHHLCENPACVRLDHLEVKSQSDHIREHGMPGDWGQANKTHCPQGHPYDEINTYHYARKDGRQERHCKTCVRARKRARRPHSRGEK